MLSLTFNQSSCAHIPLDLDMETRMLVQLIEKVFSKLLEVNHSNFNKKMTRTNSGRTFVRE